MKHGAHLGFAEFSQLLVRRLRLLPERKQVEFLGLLLLASRAGLVSRRRVGARARRDVVEGVPQDLRLEHARRRVERAVALHLHLRDLQRVVDGVAAHLAEYGVLAVDPVAALERDEELRPVRVSRAAVRHRHLPAMVELDPAVQLVLERLAVHRFATAAGAGGVPCLDHEVLDDPVPDDAVVVALQAELHEVAARLRTLLRPELDLDLAMARGHQDLALRGRLQLVHCRHRAAPSHAAPRVALRWRRASRVMTV